jgi:glycine betaine/choline ABC-type transport system substrate-binding protein
VESIEGKEKEHFLLEIKLGDEVFIQRIFPAYYYHPKVRYTVDIRPKLKRILSDLTDILSSEELETTYLNYEL